jgi:hypothetical protein
MTTYKCDRCGAVTDNPLTITIAMRDPFSCDPHYDLCDHCAIHCLGWTKTVQEITHLAPTDKERSL